MLRFQTKNKKSEEDRCNINLMKVEQVDVLCSSVLDLIEYLRRKRCRFAVCTIYDNGMLSTLWFVPIVSTRKSTNLKTEGKFEN